MRHRYVIADVFTDTALEGNPVAVFTDGAGIDVDKMQPLARELNLSETVFILPPATDGEASVRIFTPSTELPFAGHPVLGAAFVVAEARRDIDTVRLETSQGTVAVTVAREGGSAKFGRMHQPVPSWKPYAHPQRLLAAIGVEASGLPVEMYCNGPEHVFIELGSEDEVASLRPDLQALADLGSHGTSCFSGSGDRWKTRMFAPSLGVPEDPATGSAAGPLAVHLARHGRIGFGAEIRIHQGAEIGRPSLLYASAHGSSESIVKVIVGGSAVLVAEGRYEAG